ncbi:MAG: 23S rRNA (uracil(1939)-C(5))-methyltransferase RlmD [Cryomorphaceae bacterium]|nr:23S rRNA (uracil(1939)-C(5))-methyltransferase RlmD [Cryomorphaceae bacterium]
MFKRGERVELEITDFAFGGKGIAKISSDNQRGIVFVPNTYPGQKVKVMISAKKKKHYEAKLLDILERSPFEKINNYQEISGAPYIFVPVKEQERLKQDSTLETFRRLSGIQEIREVFDAFISAPEHFFYRNKMEYSFSSIEHCLETDSEKDDAFALGFKRRGTWWKVESLNKASGLFDQEWEDKLKEIRKYLKSTGLKAWHPPKKTGFFRHIVVRKSFAANQLLVNLITASEGLNKFNLQAFSSFVQELMGDRIAGLLHTVNDNVADRAKIENGQSKVLFGKDIIQENLLGLNFQMRMESFFQTNPKCAELLYNKVLDYVFEEEISSDRVVLDLFCGTGTISQLLAKRNPDVSIIGVDIVHEAIEDAKKNAIDNGIKNTTFIASDVGKFLKFNPQYQGKIDTIILDPPRAGIAPKTLKKVIELEAKKIVYISCNPSTQARDASTLSDVGFKLEKYSLVDQFPHTGHIESIAKFKKK